MTQPASTPIAFRLRVALLGCAFSTFIAGCLAEVRILDSMGESGSGGAGGVGSTGAGMGGGLGGLQPCSESSDPSSCWNLFAGSGGSAGVMQPGMEPPDGLCTLGGLCQEVEVTNIDKVDLLFVIDDSGSMAEEQAALLAQLPRMLTGLTTGDANGDGMHDFAPAKDLHIGVVSTDMGAVGVTAAVGGSDPSAPTCQGFGEDGVLNDEPSSLLAGCQPTYPRFLTHTAGLHDVAMSAVDTACLAALGTNGCGFEQPLEAAFKALWPAMPTDASSISGGGVISFLGNTLGHGDRENAGFVRSDPLLGRSLLSIVVLSDEDDCSSADTRHFIPGDQLPGTDPVAGQPLSLRCFFNKQNLFAVERYVEGLRALQPGRPDLVLFNVIAGVPADLIDTRAMFESDPMLLDQHYQNILDAESMQEQVDTSSMPTPTQLEASCSSDSGGSAFPPRRLVEVARRFGENGLVQSICEDDLGPAADAIVEQIGRHTGAVCLDSALARRVDGRVACDLVWELPLPGMAAASTPMQCGQPGFEFLRDDGRMSSSGEALCTVDQIAVRVDASGTIGAWPVNGAIDGWYYDDFSVEVDMECRAQTAQRVAFTPNAKPPTGVRVYLDCSADATQP